MTDRRRYTGTKTLQTGWTALVFVATVALSFAGLRSPLVTVAGAGGIWVVGLVVLGLRDRRHWSQLSAASSFDAGIETHTSDLQKILHGQSVTVNTDVPGLLSQAHLFVRANVEGVDASFTIRIEDAASADRAGVTTGDEALDDRFAIRGKEGNVAAVLTDDVREALLAVETPGVFTVTGDAVVYELPFTQVTAAELDAAGDAAAAIAAQLEAIGRERAATADQE
jgi:hypothetical protein